MSKTYKHQNKYWFKSHDWDSTWTRTNWYAVFRIENAQAKPWHRWANRICRRKAKSLINKGQYVEAEMLKPRNVDWEIW